MNTVIHWLLQTMITTTLMVPVVVCLCRCFRDRPSVQHAFWLIVLLKFVTPPIVWFPVVVPSMAVGFLEPRNDALITTWKKQQAPAFGDSLGNTFHSEAASNRRHLEEVEYGAAMVKASLPHRQWLTIAIACVWCGGLVLNATGQLQLIRNQLNVVRGSVRASRRLRSLVAEVALQMKTNNLPTWIAAGISSPFIWCLCDLKLVWPEQMDNDESAQSTKAIIAHELSHISRRDHWIAWIELIGGVLWWWNPLYWFVRNNLRTTAEMACDAKALSVYPDARSVYAETLFALSVFKTGVPALGLAVGTGTPSSLERRISMMMSENVSGKLSRAGILVSLLLAAAALPAYSLTQSADRASAQDSAALGPTTPAEKSEEDAFQIQNMTRILAALHNYQDAFGTFPPAVIVDPASKVSRSWRVELLPFLDKGTLYEQYKRNESWDSADNMKVLSKMPAVYRLPHQPTSSTMTTITAACGRGMVFESPAGGRADPVEGVSLASMLDGSAFTIAILQVKTEIPWTKPEEITIDLTQKALPEVGFEESDLFAGFADGSVAKFSRKIELPVLKAYLSARGSDTKDLESDEVYLQKMRIASTAEPSVPVKTTPSATPPAIPPATPSR